LTQPPLLQNHFLAPVHLVEGVDLGVVVTATAIQRWSACGALLDTVLVPEEFADLMAAVPGLLAKVWLQDADEHTYGGIDLLRDREACQSFLAGELWAQAVEDESMFDLASHDFAVMEELTKATHPGMKLL
jgi:hypothetical protein